ncbi:MAG: hypothetical protein NVSMB56_05030 [Pyrinomonadaceae bacterium]
MPVVVKKTFPPPEAPVYPEDGDVFRTSALPEYINVPLFWNVFAAIVVVAAGVPIFSEKIVVCPSEVALMARRLNRMEQSKESRFINPPTDTQYCGWMSKFDSYIETALNNSFR